jgi:hypothetical protein
MKDNITIRALLLFILFATNSCAKFLDVVPDNVATLDNAFTTRIEAKKYLFTCYSYIMKNGDLGDDPAMVGGDELWRFSSEGGFFSMAMGLQNVVGPLGDRWGFYFRAIRDCNIFLENIHKVPDLTEEERRRWIAEVTFLKGYYHFYLVMMYGPIPLMKTNLPINADGSAINLSRAPVDSCFHYILQLVDEATNSLPPTIIDPANELGRITMPIALSLKAKIMVYAASPLFNGNGDESGLKNRDGTQLFNSTFSQEKWTAAADACKKAIDACHQAGMKLYKYRPDFQQYNLSDTMLTQLSIRNAFCERWNSGIIWTNTQTNSTGFQQLITTYIDPGNRDITVVKGQLSPPLNMVELFYSNHGVPITEDKTWDYANRYDLKVAGEADKLYLWKGYTTAYLNFNREPRFYADLGFDGGLWYGQGRYDDQKYSDLFYLEGKYRQRNGFGKPGYGSITGYYLKKAVHFQNVIGRGNDYSVTSYSWPVMRLSALYLLYAEALNESQGPGAAVYNYVNLVREQAGLPSVETAWTTYSNNPIKYTSQRGMRDIIHQETLIELAFEGQRFWDLRRWKEAQTVLNRPIKGWDLIQETAAAYYRPKTIFNQTFGLKNYFWPISEGTLATDKSLVQNLGW